MPPLAALLWLICVPVGAEVNFDGQVTRPDLEELQDDKLVLSPRQERHFYVGRLLSLIAKARTQDIDSVASVFEDDLRGRGKTLADLGFPIDTVAKARRQGYIAEFRMAEAKARKANTQDFEEAAERMVECGRKAGVSEAAMRAELAAMRSNQSARLASCTPKDLTPMLPEVRDQGQLSWCFAYTAADLLSVKSRKAVSAIDVALTYHLNRDYGINLISNEKSKTERDGNVKWALEEAAERGVCWEEDLPSSDFGVRVDAAVKLHRDFERLLDQISERERTEPASAIGLRKGADGSLDSGKACQDGYEARGPNPYAARRQIASDFCLKAYGDAVRLFPNLTRSQFFEALAYIRKADILATLADQSCRRYRIPPIKTERSFRDFVGAGGMISTIFGQLDADNVVSITYDRQLILTGKGKHENAYHSSSVVGRRWDEAAGACEVLVRNSQGSGCAYGFQCENGHVWVPIDVLAPTVKDVTWIK